MATGSLLMGTLRGKLGESVLYRSQGKQRIRARVTEVKNPKTQLQTIQRLVLASAAKTVAALAPIVDHSWQSQPYGAESKRYARKQIMKVLRAQVVAAYNDETRLTTTQQVGIFPTFATGAAIASYPISQGSIPQIPTMVAEFNRGYIDNLAVSSEMTVAQFVAALGVTLDTQLTFVFLTPKALTGEDVTPAFYNGDVRYARVNFLSTAESLPVFVAASESASSPLVFNPAVVDATRSTNFGLVLFGRTDNDLNAIQYNYANAASISDSNAVGAFTVIASRLVGGVWQRSTQSLSIGYPVAPSAAAANQDKVGYNFFEDVLDSQMDADAVAEDRYLNKEKN